MAVLADLLSLEAFVDHLFRIFDYKSLHLDQYKAAREGNRNRVKCL